MPSFNRTSSNGTNRKKRRSIGDDISHHRVNLPSSTSGISVAAAETAESALPAANQGNTPTTATPTAVASCESALEAAKYARQMARSIGRHSTNFDPRKEIAIPRFLPDEVVLGSKLGRGGFSNVYEVVRFDLREDQMDEFQRPNIMGKETSGIVGVPVGGALSDSHRELMARRRRNSRRLSSQSSGRSSRGSSNRDLDLDEDYDLEEKKSGDDGDSPDDDDDDDDDDDANENNGGADSMSETSSSDDEIPEEQLERICRRVSGTSFGSDARGLSMDGSDSDDDAGNVVHPTLQRGGSTPHLFSNYHTEARQFLARHCIRDAKSRNEPSTPRYAIKRLRADVMEDDDAYQMGAADLVIEARFLACLEHPNIVKIRGMTHGDCDAFASGIEGDYFLILDRLSESLTQRIEKWKKEVKLSRGKHSGFVFDRQGKKWNSLLAKRLECGFEIANALKYLHSKNIIFRDLKPDNVGFDCRGDVKIFDFGLAKEMRDDERVDDPRSARDNGHPRSAMAPGAFLRASARRKGKRFTDVYEMSAPCGSYRYMSPEVMLAKPYNFSADTYSFAVLLYEISMLKKPYDNMGREELIEKVTVERYRPELPTEGRTALPSSLRTYLSLAWSHNLRYRPTMEGTCGTLFKCLETLKGSNDIDEGKRPSAYDRRRSTFVMRGASLRNLGLGTGVGSNRSLMGTMGKIGSSRKLFKRGSSMDSD